MHVRARHVHGEHERVELLVYLAVVDRVRQRRELGALRYRRQALREGPDGAHVVVALDVLAAARHGHLVEHLEEVVVEHVGEGTCRPLLGGQLRPAGVDGLRVAENRLDVVLQAQLLGPAARVAPVRQG